MQRPLFSSSLLSFSLLLLLSLFWWVPLPSRASRSSNCSRCSRNSCTVDVLTLNPFRTNWFYHEFGILLSPVSLERILSYRREGSGAETSVGRSSIFQFWWWCLWWTFRRAFEKSDACSVFGWWLLDLESRFSLPSQVSSYHLEWFQVVGSCAVQTLPTLSLLTGRWWQRSMLVRWWSSRACIGRVSRFRTWETLRTPTVQRTSNPSLILRVLHSKLNNMSFSKPKKSTNERKTRIIPPIPFVLILNSW